MFSKAKTGVSSYLDSRSPQASGKEAGKSRNVQNR